MTPIPPDTLAPPDKRDLALRRRFDAPPDPHLLDYLLIVGRYRVGVIALILLCGLSAAVLAFTMPQTYEAQVTILPPDRASSSSLLSNFQAAGALKMLKEVENPSVDLLQNILEAQRTSHNIGNEVSVASYFRKAIVPKGDFSTPEEWVASILSVNPENTRLKVTATLETGWRPTPVEQDSVKQVAARIANIAALEVYRFFQDELHSSSRAMLDVAEREAAARSAELDSLERSFEAFQSGHRAVALPDQVAAIIATDASLKSQVVQLRIKQAVNERLYTAQAADREALDRQYQAAAQAVSEYESKVDLGPSIAKLPELARESAQFQRQIKTLEPVVIFLRQEVEQERINAARDRDVIQVLDPATPPRKKTAPHRLTMIVLGLTVGVAAGFGYAGIRVFLHDMRSRLNVLAEPVLQS